MTLGMSEQNVWARAGAQRLETMPVFRQLSPSPKHKRPSVFRAAESVCIFLA